MSNQSISAVSSRQKTKILCEGALMVAAAVAFSYLKIKFLQAGSIIFSRIIPRHTPWWAWPVC